MSDKNNRSLGEHISRATLARLKDAPSIVSNYSIRQNDKRNLELGERKKIGVIDADPKRLTQTPEGLTDRQQELREAVINKFTCSRISKYIAEQAEHINYHWQIADVIRGLFDEHGKLPANAPIEAIIAEREKIESEIRWLEAITSALRNYLNNVKEIEDLTLELIGGQNKK
jgi:hypothetical protein